MTNITTASRDSGNMAQLQARAHALRLSGLLAHWNQLVCDSARSESGFGLATAAKFNGNCAGTASSQRLPFRRTLATRTCRFRTAAGWKRVSTTVRYLVFQFNTCQMYCANFSIAPTGLGNQRPVRDKPMRSSTVVIPISLLR